MLFVSVEGYRGIYSYAVGACAIELPRPLCGQPEPKEATPRAVAFEDRPLYKGGLVVGWITGAIEVFRVV